jgi:hypothetical protein
MKTVRVTAAKFTSTFKTDGVVREADFQLRFMIGWSDEKVRGAIKKNRWQAAIIGGADALDEERSQSQARHAQDLRQKESGQGFLCEPERREAKGRRSEAFAPVVFTCAVCGKYACYGHGVALLKDQLGTWFCRDHKDAMPSVQR